MPEYVYGCKDKEHPKKEVTHSVKEDPVIKCDTCGEVMHRVPQPFRYTLGAHNVLHEWCDENFVRYRARKKGYKAPPFSKDKVQRVRQPQKDFSFR